MLIELVTSMTADALLGAIDHIHYVTFSVLKSAYYCLFRKPTQCTHA